MRADNLQGGKAKSCGCQQHTATTGRRNHMSGISPTSAITPRFHIYGYTAPKYMVGKHTVSKCYAVVFVLDPAHPGYWQDDDTKYYMTLVEPRKWTGGNKNTLVNATMSKLARLGWMNARPEGMTYLNWARSEGVIAAPTKKLPSQHHLEEQHKHMMRGAHIDFRGQTL